MISLHSLADDVSEFHERFGHPAPPVQPGRIGRSSHDLIAFRIRMVTEEVKELQEECRWAMDEIQHRARLASECVDVAYVALGTLVALGIEVPHHVHFEPNTYTHITSCVTDARRELAVLQRLTCESIYARSYERTKWACIALTLAAFEILERTGGGTAACWQAVHEANMAKAPNPDGEKPLKPEGWVPADLAAILGG